MFGSSRWSPMGSNSNAGCDESFKHRLSGTGGKHGAPWSETRSVVGQSRRFRDVCRMSGLPQTADISGPGRHFAFVPLAVVVVARLPAHRVRDMNRHGDESEILEGIG